MKFDQSAFELRLLRVVGEGVIGERALAQRLQVTYIGVHTTCRSLEQRYLVVRDTRRPLRWRLTAQGCEMVKAHDKESEVRPRIYTVGHSTLPIDRFVALLVRHDITELVDIRRYPGSRRHPQFAQDALQDVLYRYGIRYEHLSDLGGRRSQIVAGSGNEGWRVSAFRAYADYAIYSPAFRAALDELIAIAHQQRTAYMCSEHTHLQCHRRIVSDYLMARGWDVEHISSTGALAPHSYTAHAQVSEGQVHYPAEHPAVMQATLL